MDFVSTRFVGDPFLQAIFDSPDTSTLHMAAGDTHTDSVRRVQQALTDLGWPARCEPPIYEDIVIGIYGPLTTRVVQTYKTHYGIIYPGATTITGTLGPQTIRKLDVQIAFWDESVAAINAKIAALRAGGLAVDDTVDSRYIVLLGHNSIVRYLRIDNTEAGIFNTFDVGCFEVHGNIFNEYWPMMDVLGMPVSDEYATPEGYRRSDFLHGSLFCDPSDGVVWSSSNDSVRGPVL